MKNKYLINLRRTETLELAKSLPIEIIDLIPEGFSINIRWNLGHILVAWDHEFIQIWRQKHLPLKKSYIN